MTTSIQIAMTHGKVTTTSLDIAEHFNRKHNNVIRDIQKLGCSKEFYLLNFEQISYKDNNREYPAYQITRDGFTMLAMGFTGRNATQWKEAYINAFNQMEKELLTPELPAFYKQELLAARPLWRKVLRYRTLGLNFSEISKLISKSESTVRRNVHRMELCGLLEVPENMLEMQQMALRLQAGGDI